jgi:hypothetical protein
MATGPLGPVVGLFFSGNARGFFAILFLNRGVVV